MCFHWKVLEPMHIIVVYQKNLKTMLLTLASLNGQALYKKGMNYMQVVVDASSWRYTKSLNWL
jgi:hypothetical protein